MKKFVKCWNEVAKVDTELRNYDRVLQEREKEQTRNCETVECTTRTR